MPEMSTAELYRYRSHRTLPELHDYKKLRVRIRTEGVRTPVELVTDGRFAFLQEGHKRVMIAMEMGIEHLPVTIIERPFSVTRRMKFLIGPELAELLEKKSPETVGSDDDGDLEGDEPITAQG